MKKIYLILGIILMVQIVGCNANNETNDQSNNTLDKPKEPVLAMNNVPEKEDLKKGTIKLTKTEFLQKVWDYEKNPQKWVFQGDKPCLIDFYADWCAPCRRMAPILEELAQEYYGQVNIYKIDIEKEKELATVFQIQSIPSFLIIPQNDQPQMHSGMGSKEMFKEIIEKYMLKNKI